MNLESKIEAFLFYKAEPVAIKKIAEFFECSEEDVKKSLADLEEKLKGRGLVIVRKEEEVMLGTSSECSPIIEKITKEELVRDLGKAGIETLAIVLYRGPLARREIDYIRGVNSNFILRNLLVRGLVERVQDSKDQRQFLYKATFDLLTFMGLKNIGELPEYEKVRQEIEVFKKEQSNTADGSIKENEGSLPDDGQKILQEEPEGQTIQG